MLKQLGIGAVFSIAIFAFIYMAEIGTLDLQYPIGLVIIYGSIAAGGIASYYVGSFNSLASYGVLSVILWIQLAASGFQ